ncbi:hypothetical protein GF373_06570 [bacterium]|nr:hypothetical protein [bacterium]
MKNRKRKQIGEIVDAYWDEQAKAVRFTIYFSDWDMRMQGSCPSGIDPVTKAFVSSTELKAKAKKFIGMKVYDESGAYSSTNGKPDYEKIKKIRFNISLNSMSASVTQGNQKPSWNTFLSRL